METTKEIKIGALISGGGTNLQAVIDACKNKQIPATISFVGSDNLQAKGLKRADDNNIANFVVDYKKIIEEYKKSKIKKLPNDCDYQEIFKKQRLFKDNDKKAKFFLESRIISENILLEKISQYEFDLLILAGFMRILTPYFIDKINIASNRIMNIHPALLPSFPGTNGYEDTFNYGCKVGGCTVHFVDYGEDTGPIIGQKAFKIEEDDTIDSIKEKGLNLEWQLYPECIKLFAQDALRVEKLDNKKIVRILKK